MKEEDGLRKININIPVDLFEESGEFLITTNKESEELIGEFLYGGGKSLEEAEKEFWEMFKFISDYNRERSNELDFYKLFQKGNWKQRGGKWFSIFMIHFYFRVGKNMTGGWYIPYTNLNISINIYSKKKKNK